MYYWGNDVITLNDQLQSNCSVSTRYSDLSSEFINVNQEMIVSSPLLADNSYQNFEQEEEEFGVRKLNGVNRLKRR